MCTQHIQINTHIYTNTLIHKVENYFVNTGVVWLADEDELNVSHIIMPLKKRKW